MLEEPQILHMTINPVLVKVLQEEISLMVLTEPKIDMTGRLLVLSKDEGYDYKKIQKQEVKKF